LGITPRIKIMSDEIEQGQRNRNADQASVAAVKALKNYDFTRMMGSGINITLTKLNGETICDEFQIRAEDMEKIKPAIIASLGEMLLLRHALRTQELAEIERAIKIANGTI